MAKVWRKIVEIDEELCDGCGQCVPACAEGAIRIIDGKARLVAEKFCDGLGACLGHCPKGAIRVIEKEAEPFDEEAVKEYLAKERVPSCPGCQVEFFGVAQRPTAFSPRKSALSNWPIQLKLIPPEAPFLKEASLLVAADCVGFSHPSFHEELLPGKVLLVGCPKFDDPEGYFRKFCEIFEKNSPAALTVAIMEVPCCRGLPMLVKKALEEVGKKRPFKVWVVSTRGEIVNEEHWS